MPVEERYGHGMLSVEEYDSRYCSTGSDVHIDFNTVATFVDGRINAEGMQNGSAEDKQRGFSKMPPGTDSGNRC